MDSQKKRAPIVRLPGEGREYPMGPLRAVFKADEAETRGAYSISEWWLDPYTRGPGAHQHEEDLLGGVGGRRDGVRGEDRQRGGLAQPLVLLFARRDGCADEDALQRSEHRLIMAAGPPGRQIVEHRRGGWARW